MPKTKDAPGGPELTPEQKAAEATLAAAGLVDEVIIEGPSGMQAMPAEVEPEVPPAAEPVVVPATPAPATPTPAVAPPAVVGPTAEQIKAWEDRAGWADREKRRADEERGRREAVEAENLRLKTALGAPVIKTRTAEEEAGIKWLQDVGPEVFPKILEALPEEVIAKLPAIARRDIWIGTLQDRLDQAMFLAQFPREQQRVIQERVLPVLHSARAAGGFKESYIDLFDRQRQGVLETAAVYGLPTAAPPSAAPVPPAVPVPGFQIPPTLSGAHGAPPTRRGEAPIPLSSDEMRLMGLA